MGSRLREAEVFSTLEALKRQDKAAEKLGVRPDSLCRFLHATPARRAFLSRFLKSRARENHNRQIREYRERRKMRALREFLAAGGCASTLHPRIRAWIARGGGAPACAACAAAGRGCLDLAAPGRAAAGAGVRQGTGPRGAQKSRA